MSSLRRDQVATTAWLAAMGLCLGLGIAGCGDGRTETDDRGGDRGFRLTSEAFADGERIPVRHTCDGEDLSPPLTWEGVPPGTRALALVCEDPDAPRGTWDHWLLYNIAPEITALPEGARADTVLFGRALRGLNSWRRAEYGGPCPPPGRPHRYVFTLYALYADVDLPTGATKEQLLEAMGSLVVGRARLTGIYGRS